MIIAVLKCVGNVFIIRVLRVKIVLRKISLRKISQYLKLSLPIIIYNPSSEKWIFDFVFFILDYVSVVHKSFQCAECRACRELSVRKRVFIGADHLQDFFVGLVEVYPDTLVVEVVKQKNSAY